VEALFSGMTVQEYGFFRITHDADLEGQEYETDD